MEAIGLVDFFQMLKQLKRSTKQAGCIKGKGWQSSGGEGGLGINLHTKKKGGGYYSATVSHTYITDSSASGAAQSSQTLNINSEPPPRYTNQPSPVLLENIMWGLQEKSNFIFLNFDGNTALLYSSIF